jgi:hypothetical protein
MYLGLVFSDRSASDVDRPREASTPVRDVNNCPVCGKGPFRGERGLKSHILKVHGSNTLPDQMSTLLLNSSASDCEASSTDG